MATTPQANSNTPGATSPVPANVEIIPGTDLMQDESNTHNVLLKHTRGGGTILIPQPTNNLSDPLNWSWSWKCLVIIIQFLYTFVTVESALSLAPMFPLLGKEWHLDETQLSLLTGACVLALGYANFIIVPFSNIFGRRMTSLILALLVLLTEVWEALATSYNSFLAARVLNGLTTATAESLMVQVISDIFFLHERGLWMGIYFTSYFFGLFLGPIMAGNIAERHGWRSFFWLSLALSCFNLVTIIFFFPETKYRRSTENIGGAVKVVATNETNTVVKEGSDLNESSKEGFRTGSPSTEEDEALHGKGKPAKWQFMPWQKPDPRWKSFIIRDVLSPFRIFFYPIIFWAGLNVAGPANLLLFWNLTESAVLGGSPYDWTAGNVGYSNFAFFVGGCLGLLTAGPFSDWVAQRATRRNHGVREAEMRLPAMIPFFITTVIGIVVGGIAYERRWNWPLILVFGYGLTGLSVTTIPTIAIAYAVDCYKPISGEIMVVATVLKNTCGFGMSYWVPPMSAQQGYIPPAMVEFALTIGPLLLTVPLYFYGKKLRELTKNSGVHKWSEY